MDDVLHQGAELDGTENFRLPLLGQINALGIAAALKVEDGVVRPAVFVVADEFAVGVGGESGLAGAGEAEEQGGIPGVADVGGAVHGENTLLGHEVVHHGEDGLLDLTRILGTGDKDHFLLIVNHNRGLGVDVVPLRDALEAGGADDGEVSLVVCQLLCGGTQEQLMDEQVLRGQLVDDPEGFGVLGVRAREAVEDENLTVLQVGRHFFVQGVKDLLGGGDVDLTPGDVIVDAGGIDNKFVVRGPACIFAGVDAQCAGGVQLALAPGQSLLHQLCRGKVPVYGAGMDDAQRLQAKGFHHSLPP